MITVGYGDVTPQNSAERIYVIIMTIFTTAIFGKKNKKKNIFFTFTIIKAYSVNKIASIFSHLGQKEKNYEQNKYIILKFLN